MSCVSVIFFTEVISIYIIYIVFIYLAFCRRNKKRVSRNDVLHVLVFSRYAYTLYFQDLASLPDKHFSIPHVSNVFQTYRDSINFSC